ncbi:UvrD/REP helicase [Colletotrichum higginsianum IMI 349063]|uniref:DNA 3'-5' helicase n=2 Tax=Colletotrichum higginsianum TaxID=80884 RepID=A0A1B7YBJ6_COLHI|nr:UvrD/REP helicase [Colletotrichum higginsianum IMI 349063]OBR09473.1 UvrD/REP helicase [Colletotrichum higginsianum IMI 349063]TIC95182.1 ATP-dependent DNA helicase srs2 [Colletotrichum higginsianum]
MKSSSSAPGPAESILATLNTAQCRAVTSSASTVAILAGPGSGKTHTLTSRVVWLVDNVGYAPTDIIVATFTVKAAREMKERIAKALGDDRGKRIVLGTFHSIARRYLAAYGKHIGLDEKFAIADDTDSRSIIQRICKRFQLSVDPAGARSWISKKKAKGENQTPAKRSGKEVPQSPDMETCFREYQSHLERSNLLDYDDLLTRCVELLRKHPACVANVQAVLIDEYQDTNGIQYELMRLFAQARERITIVGDPDQSIYGWRSAEIKNLYRLLKDYPNAEEISLEENYRSSQAILDVSLKVIQQDKKRYQKVLLPIHNKGTRPVLRRLKSSAVEAEWIVSEIKRTLLMAGKMLTHDDVAILLRSASLSRHIESALGKAGMAYRMVGGFKFYDRIEVKVILDYLRVIHQPDNNDAVARIINVPRRGIGDTTIKALLEEAESSKLSVWALLNKHCRGERQAKTNIKKAMEQKISGDLLRLVSGVRRKIKEPPNGSPYYHLVDLIENLLSQLNFQAYLRDNYPEEHEARWANVQEFISLAGDFMRDLSATADEDRLPQVDGVQQVQENDALGRFLANVSLASDAQQKGDADNKPMVTISTIHAAKGLEWPVVFVPAVYNGSIPHMRSEDPDEERRLLYVAMTRAQSLLYLSCPMYSSQNGGNGGERTELSKFIPSEIHPYFRKCGPSFEPGILQEIGRILRRESEVPSQDKVYKDMPLLERPEDNLYPEDPESSFGEADAGGRSRQWQRRPRPQAVSASEEGDSQPVPTWHASTTMDGASNFTLPGFTTASAAQAMLAAAKDMATSAQRSDQGRQGSAGPRRGTTKRPADQRSLLGFVKRSRSDLSDTAGPVANRAPAVQSRLALQELPELPNLYRAQRSAPTIEPDLGGHRLGAGKLPVKPGRAAIGGIAGPKKHYANFSSSPPRPKSPEKENQSTDELPTIRERPASCLHATTTTNGFGGFKRPAALKKEGGIAPIDRLRKPFKPLTMNRP